MKRLLFLLTLTLVLVGCDNGGSSTYSSSSAYTQPTTRTVKCSYCNGGIVFNPYDGNYYYCQNCGGAGAITVTETTGGSNPSFGSGGKACTETVGCDCTGFDKVGAYGPEQFICKHCHHNKQYHTKGRL